MSSSRKRLTVACLSIAGVLLVGWWLFGWSVYEDHGLRSVSHRFFGRVVRIDLTSDQSPAIVRFTFPWSAPYEAGDPVDCTGAPPELWRDDDGDGRWDIWIRRTHSEPGHCINEYSVDVTGDGTPDARFKLPSSQWKEAETRITALRRGKPLLVGPLP